MPRALRVRPMRVTPRRRVISAQMMYGMPSSRLRRPPLPSAHSRGTIPRSGVGCGGLGRFGVCIGWRRSWRCFSRATSTAAWGDEQGDEDDDDEAAGPWPEGASSPSRARWLLELGTRPLRPVEWREAIAAAVTAVGLTPRLRLF